MEADLVIETTNKGYIEARALYYDDRPGEAIEAAEQLLEYPGILQYHRIKRYMIFAACVDDWEDADNLLTKFEVLWQMACELVTRRGCEMGAERDEDAELALAELRDEIDSLKRQHDAERPDEGLDMQLDEDKLMEQAAAQLRGQLEEDEFDDEMDVDEHVDEDDGAVDVAGDDE